MIRFFIGTDTNGGCAECNMVLEYSIKKHCSMPYEIVRMSISDDPSSFWHGWNTSKWSTPFSGFRYGIAEYCGFEGKAIYCDDDQLFLQDPAELWNIKISDDKIMTGKQLSSGEIRHCVSLIDCSKWKDFGNPHDYIQGTDDKQYLKIDTYNEWMKGITFPRTQIMDGKWNNFDGEDKSLDEIGLHHLTDMSTNPGVHLAIKRLGDQSKHWYDGPLREHPRQDVVNKFMQYYEEALASGMRVEDYLPEKMIEYTKQSQKDYSANNGWHK